ncbi:conserved Plasmodium protein, unknown function [Plasmodium chabaudi chabaudi]|uniref:Uncharacterized protein n=1 Tax=Plasmodium chabaudi chabaudi TaxID=31271 RepID=A0A4V0KBN5_PLACU|nr:conserved Plasmodium protein, unknown function [Plasmodium chabaudi chabaudi]VTZ70346.1 conserved Plasmodium protein, unknown function [Plasmodium chabaudi chabaudi]|eukprot:XP_735390.2 conserved Plasmodium protein, unknown function [Plasmodium chabaudi chabaudi]
MRKKSEIPKLLTPLRRIPKNRGMVVRNTSEINPLSEKEIKNVIEVYSGANKAYYENYIKNETTKKKKKKKNLKKSKSKKFDSLSLNPLNYRNKDFEENKTLLHLPGSNVTPNYTIQSQTVQYAVSSMPYETLHKSNPLSWGCQYTNHYELPTICSIVKSKHPIYSRANNGKTKRNISKNNNKKKGEKKKKNINLFEKTEMHVNNAQIKEAPTFGNYIDEFSDFINDKNQKNDFLDEHCSDVDAIIKNSKDSDRSKNIVDKTYIYSDFYHDLKNSHLKNNINNYNFTLKGNDTITENNTGSSNFACKDQNDTLNSNKELNDENVKSHNKFQNVSSNNLVDNNLSNSILPKLNDLNTYMENHNVENKYFNYTVSDCSNYSNNKYNMENYNDKKEDNVVNSHNIDKFDHNYNCNEINNKSSPKKIATKGCETITKNAKLNDIHVLKKKSKDTVLSSMPPHNEIKNENNNKTNICGLNKNMDVKKKKQKNSKLKKNNSIKNNLDNEENISNESSYNKCKQNSKEKSLKPKKKNSKMNKLQNGYPQNTSLNNETFKSMVKCQVDNTSNIHQNATCMDQNLESKNTIYDFAKNHQKDLCKIESFPINSKVDNAMHKSIPMNGIEIINGNEINNNVPPTCVYIVQDENNKNKFDIHNMNNKMPGVNEKNPTLDNSNLYNQDYSKRIYQTAPIPQNNQNYIFKDYNTPVLANPIPNKHPQSAQIPSELNKVLGPISIIPVQAHAIHTNPQIPSETTQLSVAPVQLPMAQTLTHIIPQALTHVTPTQIPVSRTLPPMTQTQISLTQAQASITPSIVSNGNPNFRIIRDLSPQLYAKSAPLSAPFIEKPIIIDNTSLVCAYPNKEHLNIDKTANLIDLSRLPEFKNNNAENSSYLFQNNAQYNVDSCIIKSIAPNVNASYNNKVENNIYDLKNRQYPDKVNTIFINNNNDIIDNKNSIFVDRVKTDGMGMNFVKLDQVSPQRINGYINEHNTNVKNDNSNMRYINIYPHSESENISCNIINSDDNLNRGLGIAGIFQCNNSQQTINKNCANKLNLGDVIKNSNNKMLNLQNKELMNILNDNKNDKSDNNRNNILNIQNENNSQNILEDTRNSFSRMSVNPNYMNNGIIRNTDQLIQNNSHAPSHLN